MARDSDTSFLAGGGEMGRRIRRFDWGSTAVGAPESWPQSLRTTVRMMLDSKFAMWMAWGPALTFFCNDAYLPTVGLKRDWVLGARSDKVWEEIWHDIGPRIRSVLVSGQATWDDGLQLFLRRSGYEEETFHTFSYSPVYDEANRIAGMLCVVVEVTERVIGERRLNILRELASVPVADAPDLQSVGARLLGALRQGPFDVPFAAFHLAAPAVPGTAGPGEVFRLAGATADFSGDLAAAAGLAGPAPAAAPGEEAGRWLDLAHGDVRAEGAWQEPVRQALVAPLHAAGSDRVLGSLLLAASTRRTLDAAYQSFMRLVADQFAAKLSDVQARLDAEARAESLAALDRAKNAFFSNVSHELRTPLTLLLGPLEDALRNPSLAPETRELLRLAQRNGTRLRRLVNSLLDFSRIEAGRADTHFQATDLATYTVDLAALFRSAIEGAGLAFTVEVEADLPPVYVDRDMWERVVLNLLSNAFKFTFEGRIALALRRHGERVRLTVGDTGIGIQRSELARVFERFQRVAGSRSRVAEGSGIGLALVRELVKLHGGTISVDSEWGRGTTFTVEVPLGHAHLPAERLDPALTPTRLAIPHGLDESLQDMLGAANSTFRTVSAILAPAAAPADGALARAHVLVVDDNADMRAYLERLLQASWSVELASDGEEALAAIARRRPDLMVTDVMMPGMDGFELIRRVRVATGADYLPVLVLSARAGDEARVAGLHQGADDYLVKPFSAPELLARIEVQLMRSQVRRVEEAVNKQLADVFREAPVGVALLRGPDHVFEFANPVYSGFVNGRELIGRPLREALPEVVAQGVVDRLDEVRRSGRAYKGRSVPVDLTDPRTGAVERRHFEVVYQPIAETTREPRGIAVVVLDVSDAVSARLMAEEASRVKDEFMAVLGHELRNPLAPIFAALQLMKRRAGDVAVREREIIDRQAHHMARLVDDLMDISRITRGNLALHRVPVEIARVVHKAVETSLPLFRDKQQHLRVEVPRVGLTVFGDETRLCQVVANLLVNASKFTGVGGQAQVRAEARDGQVVLVVADTGVGLQPDEVGRVFETFVQGQQETHRPRGGLGLGLAIARNLVRLHGGSLTAHSDGPGRGTAFTLTLALVEPDAVVASPARVEPVSSRTLRVLVVDDNLDAADATAELLRDCGHEVQVAADGPEALRLAEAGDRFDAAVLDIGLPGMDGYELGARLRGLASTRRARLVALTGFGQAGDARRSAAQGFDAHLVKPVELGLLLQALETS